MAKFFYAISTALFLLSGHAQAQYAQAGFGASAQLGVNAQFGTGAYMGANNYCPYDYGPAEGSVDDSDEVDAKRKARSKAKSEADKAKREVEAAKKIMDRNSGYLKARLNGNILQDVKQHIEQGANVDQWTSECDPTASANTPGGAAQKPYKTKSNWCTINPDKSKNWAWVQFARDGGEIDPSICNQEKAGAVFNTKSGVTERIYCERAIADYGPSYQKYKEAVEKAAQKEAEYVNAKIEYDTTRERVKAEMADDDTEGEVCATCAAGRRRVGRGPSTGQIVGGGILAALGGYLAYKGGKYAIDRTVEGNTSIGFPTRVDPYWAIGAGYPLIQAGLYGVLGGGAGAGGFACAGSIGNAGPGGAFSYPGNMMGPQAGGNMWMPGMSAMLNPFAGGGGSPFGGNGFGSPFGSPFGGNGFGSPFGSPFGGNGFGSPFGGNGFGSPFGGGGQFGGNPMAAYQMQQMQAYMAQQQQQAQQMQAYLQDYMYRQQTVAGLQQQMYQIQMQIYQVSSGSNYYGGTGAPSILPYPSNTGYPGSIYNGTGSTCYPYCSTTGNVNGYNGPGTPVYQPRTGR